MTQTVGIDELPGGARPARVGQVTVLVHTRNQAAEVADVVTRLEALPGATAGEIVFVDDSDDDTPEVIRAVADRVVIPVHLLHRERRHRDGLAGAVEAGMRLARFRHVCVIDCAEHVPEEIPELVAAAASTSADLVVGGREDRFFLVRRGAVDLEGVRARGGRLVRELIRRSPGLRVAEIPRTGQPSASVTWRAAWPAAPHAAG